MNRTILFLITTLSMSVPVISSCEDNTGTSISEGCKKDSDCPLPDRQKCKIDLGVCVGHTTEPGDIDGSVEDTVSDSSDSDAN